MLKGKNIVMSKKLFVSFLLCGLLFISCADKTVTYKSVSQSDWLLRLIGEEVEVEFNLEKSLVTIRDIERSFLKDKTKDVMQNTWYCRGTYEGNPEQDGIIKIDITEYSLDFVNWTPFTEDADVSIFDANQIEIKDGKFIYDDEEFILLTKAKEHKKIEKQIASAKKLISQMNKKSGTDFTSSRKKLQAIYDSLKELKSLPEWTSFDETDLFTINEYLERYNKK